MFRISPHMAFWLTIAFLLLVFLAVLSDILLPFALGMVIAYLFDPIVDRLNRAGIPRLISSLVIVTVITLLFLAILAIILPAVLEQLLRLVQSLPQYIEAARAYVHERWGGWLEPLRQQLFGSDGAQGAAAQQGVLPQGLAEKFAPWIAESLQSVLSSGLALFNSLAFFFLTPVVAFFLLKDWDIMIRNIDRVLPREDAPTIRQIAGEIDDTISNYLRGQFTVLLILSAFYMVALQLLGLDYGLLIGLTAGLISFIPYLGAFTGFVLSGAVATYQFWPDWFSIAAVLGVFVIGQAIEGNVLTPKIVGDKVRLHPVWLIFALVALGYLFGFTGLIVAVPVAAVIGVLVRHVLRRYYQSEAYLSEGEAVADAMSGKRAKRSREDA